MHGLWNFFLENKAFTVLVMIASTTAGIAALFSLPKESTPEIDVPVVVVATTMRGASAEDMAELVTRRIEKEVGTVSNISSLTSSSRESVSVITAEFDTSADLTQAVSDVKDAVDRARPTLPRDADDPSVTRVRFSDQPILILSLAGDFAPAQFAEVGKDAQEELEKISGVSRVELVGVQNKQVQVIVAREALASYGLSIASVIGALSASNSALPVGTLTLDNVDYTVSYHGDLSDPSELSGIVVSSAGGTPVYLSDIATIVNGIEPKSRITRVSTEGDPAEHAITLYVYKKSGGDITKVTKAVKEKLSEMESSTLVGVTNTISFDAGKEVTDNLSELTRVGIETMILVMLSLLATIGWRESLVAGLSIPLSFAIAFIGLQFSGNTINFISLFSLILAIGILVDSGIVVTEAIHTRRKALGDGEGAARQTLREYAWPLTAGTLTTVAMFFPLFFLSGIIGQFIASIPYTVIFVLGASIVVALGFVPIIALRFASGEQNRLEILQEHYTAKADAWYRSMLHRVLANRKFQGRFLRRIAAAFFIVLLLPFFGVIKSVFLPPEDAPFVYFDIEAPRGTTLEKTDLAVRAVEELLYADPRVESFVTEIGASSAFNQNGPSSGDNIANITANLLPNEEREETSGEIVEEYRSKLAEFHEVAAHAYSQSGGPPSGAPVVVTFSGDNLSDLARAASIGERVLKATEGASDVASSAKDNGIALAFTVDRAKAAQVGLTSSDVASILRTTIAGVTATTIRKDKDDIDVIVLANLNPNWTTPETTANASPEAVLNTLISTPAGNILLGSVLAPTLEEAPAVINRKDQKNITTVSSYLIEGSTATDVSNAFAEAMKGQTLPESVTMSLGGETEDIQQSFTEMFYALGAGMVLMLAILVLAFNSFRYAFYLLMLVPLSLIGVFIGLLITSSPISFSSLLGIIALAGVIINHAIILVDAAITRMKNPGDRTLEDVVVDASASRLRPIVLTTAATVFGMIPLSTASAIWGPLAFSIMFGLAFSMLLTLVLTPILIFRHPGKFWQNKIPLLEGGFSTQGDASAK